MGKTKVIRTEIATIDSFPEFRSGHKKVGFVSVPWVETRSCDSKLYVNLRYPADVPDDVLQAIKRANKAGCAAAATVALSAQIEVVASAYEVAFKASLVVSAAEMVDKVKYHINRDKVCGGWHS